jgi:hypothetical protein
MDFGELWLRICAISMSVFGHLGDSNKAGLHCNATFMTWSAAEQQTACWQKLMWMDCGTQLANLQPKTCSHYKKTRFA